MDQPRQPEGMTAGGEYTFRRFRESQVELRGSSWPALTWEERSWDAPPDPAASRRSRLTARGPYEAAVVPGIADLDPQVSPHLLALTEEATMEMVRFDAEMGSGTAPFAELLLRTESASSSEIENLTAGARRIALARLGGTGSANATLIASNVRAVLAAIELSDDLSVENIAAMHRTLMEAGAPEIAGRYRQEQVWIRGNSPHTAEFVPPHHEHLAESMDDLSAFMARDDVPALLQAAVAHAQFETIHPFADGNGRTGRAIVSALLRAKGVTRNVTVPVSSGLLTDTQAYFDALGAYRDGDVEPIGELFAVAALRAVDNGRALTEGLKGIRRNWDGLVPGAGSAHKVLDLLLAEPAVTAEMVSEYAGGSVATAYRSVQRLQDAGIIAASGKVGGVSVWVAPDVLGALDAFASRAGRRRR